MKGGIEIKGRNAFSLEEIRRIRELVIIKKSLPSREQIFIRNQLRAMGFYISDYKKTNFTTKDLDVLIDKGKIKVGKNL